MMSPIRTLIGSRIRFHRKSRQITQAALAEAIECEVTSIGRYERGEHSPDVDQLVKLAIFFDVSPLEFLPAEIDVRWQTVCELRSLLIDLVYRIDDPTALQRLITSAKSAKKS